MFSRFIHLAACYQGRIFSLLWLKNVPLYLVMFIYHNHQLMDNWVDSTFLWLNNTAMGIFYKFLCRHRFSFLLRMDLGIELLGHRKILCLKILKDWQCFPKCLYHFTFHWQWMRTAVAPHPHQQLIRLNFRHSNRHIVVSRCGFNLHFPNNEWCWTSSHVLICHPCIFFSEVSKYFLSIFKIGQLVFLLASCKRSSGILDTSPLSDM